MEATIIDFPHKLMVAQPVQQDEEHYTCEDCQNVYMGTLGLFCGAFKEPITDPEIAEDCPEFTPF